MIDLHSHVLPGLDDGAADESAAVAMCRMAAEDGIATMVATPHLYGGIGLVHPGVISAAAERLRRRLAEERIELDLRYAAEMPLMENAMELYRSGEWPAYDAGRRYVLLEMPPIRNGLDILRDTIFRLRLEGATPILAHPERLDFLDDLETVEGLRTQGALLQITATCLFASGSREHGRAMEWIRRGWVHVIASDAHDVEFRPPRLAAARRWLKENIGFQVADDLTRGNPLKILCGESI
jgi:protein-tyrosine phosphatase